MHLVSGRAEMQTGKYGPRTHLPQPSAAFPRDEEESCPEEAFPALFCPHWAGSQVIPTHFSLP